MGTHFPTFMSSNSLKPTNIVLLTISKPRTLLVFVLVKTLLISQSATATQIPTADKSAIFVGTFGIPKHF